MTEKLDEHEKAAAILRDAFKLNNVPIDVGFETLLFYAYAISIGFGWSPQKLKEEICMRIDKMSQTTHKKMWQPSFKKAYDDVKDHFKL